MGGDVDVTSKKCEKRLTGDELNGSCLIHDVNFNLLKDSVDFFFIRFVDTNRAKNNFCQIQSELKLSTSILSLTLLLLDQ